MDTRGLHIAVAARLRARARSARPTFPTLAAYAQRHIRLRGRPFSFAGHAYLRELYTTTPADTVFMKAAQVGLSTLHIIKAAWLARWGGGKTLYLLPTENMARLFARDRVPALLAGEAGRDVTFVRVGAGLVMFRGVLSDAGVRAQDADFVVMDELDAAAPRRVALGADRVLHSPLAWLSYLSTPTFPGAGVARRYESSDQRRWLVRCPRCRWEGDLADHFPACVAGARGPRRRCPKCARLFLPGAGRWVAAFPSRRERRGYRFSHLFTALAAEDIVRQFDAARYPHEVQRFYNSVLGLPYLPPGTGVDDDTLAGAAAGHAPGATGAPTYAGVDVGDVSHFVAAEPDGGALRVTGLAVVGSFDELAALMREYNVAFAVADAMPYKASLLDLARRFPGRVTLAYFQGAGYGVGVEKYPGGYVAKLNLERTAALDRVMAYLKEGRILLPSLDHPAAAALCGHVKNLRRVLTERADGTLTAKWLSAGPDHFGFALAYLVAAWELRPSLESGGPATAYPRRF